MTSESNAYAAVIADLKKRRDDLDAMIRNLEALSGGGPASVASADPIGPQQPEVGVGANGSPYLGMSIVDAAKAVLQKQRSMMTPADITDAIQAGGVMLSGDNPGNTVGSVLNRRSKKVGDIVSPKRGYWGLKEWYPGRNFSKKADDTAEHAKIDVAEANPTNEHEQPSEQSRVVPLRSTDQP